MAVEFNIEFDKARDNLTKPCQIATRGFQRYDNLLQIGNVFIITFPETVLEYNFVNRINSGRGKGRLEVGDVASSTVDGAVRYNIDFASFQFRGQAFNRRIICTFHAYPWDIVGFNS